MKKIISALSIFILVITFILPQQAQATKIFSDAPTDLEQKKCYL
ncbi:hypothetical protein [Lysinibacillus contaminans]|nr:hypothetical protein [Lysinibacillus contaminans]